MKRCGLYLKVYDQVISEFVPKQNTEEDEETAPLVEQKATQVEKKRLRWWKRYKISGVQGDYVKYKLVMDQARTEVRKAKIRHERTIASNIKTDPKMFYKYARSKMDVK